LKEERRERAFIRTEEFKILEQERKRKTLSIRVLALGFNLLVKQQLGDKI